MIKLHLLTLAAVIAYSATAGGQVPATLWTRTFGGTNIDVGHAVRQTADGGFIITGYTRSFGTMSGRNLWLLKTDADGIMEWNTAFGGNDDDEGYAVVQTSDGGFVAAGYTKSFGAGAKDMMLVKADSAGNPVWTRVFGGTLDDEGYGLERTSDGGFLIAGVTSSFGAGSRDVWLVRTDAAGNELWRKTHGGMSSDGAWYVHRTSDGGYIVTGWTFSYGPGYIGNAWLVRTDSAGNSIWNRWFGGSDADRGYCVQETMDGGFVLTGYTASTGAGLDDMLLIKTDSAGNPAWERTFGGTGRDYGHSVYQTADGGYIAAGYTLSSGAGGDDVWVVRTDPAGNLVWSSTYGGSASDVAYSIAKTSDGGSIIAGHTLSSGAGVHDVWLIRLASDVTGVDGGETPAGEFRLFQNYPNPFNPISNFGFRIAEEGPVQVAVFDMLGRRVATPVDTWMPPGVHTVVFDGSNLAGGVYFYRLTAGGYTETKRMMLMK